MGCRRRSQRQARVVRTGRSAVEPRVARMTAPDDFGRVALLDCPRDLLDRSPVVALEISAALANAEEFSRSGDLLTPAETDEPGRFRAWYPEQCARRLG